MPKNDKISDKSARKTRLETLIDNGGTPLLPEVEEAYYLVEYWVAAGRVENGVNGAMTITWTELNAWQSNSAIDLTPWEASTIRAMSAAYASQWHESLEPECPPPYSNAIEQIDREAIGQKVDRLFSNYSTSRE